MTRILNPRPDMHRFFAHLIRVVTRRGPAARAAGPERAGGDDSRDDPVSFPNPSPVNLEATNAPHSAAPRWPVSVLFRWEEQAGLRGAWDILPFPPGGPGVLGRLLAAASESRSCGRSEVELAPALSAKLIAGGASWLLPLEDDRDVEKAVQLWQLCPGIPGVIDIVAREGGGRGARETRGPRAAGPGNPPPSLLNSGGGPLLPSQATVVSAFEDANVDVWMGVLSAVASSR